MIADLDPVILVEFGSDLAIDKCIRNFVLPTHPHPLPPPETGMTIIILKLQLSVCMCVFLCVSLTVSMLVTPLRSDRTRFQNKIYCMVEQNCKNYEQGKSPDIYRFERGGTRRLLREHVMQRPPTIRL